MNRNIVRTSEGIIVARLKSEVVADLIKFSPVHVIKKSFKDTEKEVFVFDDHRKVSTSAGEVFFCCDYFIEL